MGASALLAIDLIDLSMAASLWLLGTLGGILPDVDSDTSKPVMWLFNTLGIGAAALTCWWLVPGPALYMLWIAMAMAFVLFGVLLREVFFHFTVHRGIYHSLLAVVFACLLSALLAWHMAGLSSLESWLTGFFVGGGYLVHLVLDECYSVDFNGARFKKSFGTALKPVCMNNWLGSLMLAIACIPLVWFGPDTETLQLVLESWQPHWWHSLIAMVGR